MSDPLVDYPIHLRGGISCRRMTVMILVGVHIGLVAWGGLRHSPVVDEPAHLAAGLSHLDTGDHSLYCVNPPLVRMIAALPVWCLKPQRDWSGWHDNPRTRSEFRVGSDFITANGADSFLMFTFARWACLPFCLAGACGCDLFARDLYSPNAALGALALWCFSPTILGHGQLLTPDVAAAAMGIFSVYAFWKWLGAFDWYYVMPAGLTQGLALATKSTWVILFGLWPFLAAIVLFHRSRCRQAAAKPFSVLAGVICIQLLALYVLNSVYEFDGTFRQLGSYQFVSRTLAGESGNRFRGGIFERVPIPLPEDFVVGIDVQKWDIESMKPSYLRGEVRRGGWWYYYLYAMAVKMPLGTLALIVITLVGLAVRAARWELQMGESVLIGVGGLVLVLVSSQTHLNKHLRYVLPLFPVLFVLAGRLFVLTPDSIHARNKNKLPGVAVTLLMLAIMSSLRAFPHCLSYFNEAAGGIGNGGFHLLSSNIAWGQDLIYLREWIDQHPEAGQPGLAIHVSFDPRNLGIEFMPPPMMPKGKEVESKRTVSARPGWYAVDANLLYGYPYTIQDGQGNRTKAHDSEFTWFQQFSPKVTIGGSINVYHLTTDDLCRVGFVIEPEPATTVDQSDR